MYFPRTSSPYDHQMKDSYPLKSQNIPFNRSKGDNQDRAINRSFNNEESVKSPHENLARRSSSVTSQPINENNPRNSVTSNFV